MSPDCPICGSAQVVSLLDRAVAPVFQNLLHVTAEAARNCARGELAMRSCARCGHAWNAAFDAALVAYGPDYDNRQECSEAFREHLKERIAAVVEKSPAGEIQVLEVGAGQGSFLADLAAAFGPGRVRRALGFDPAWRGGNSKTGIEMVGSVFDAASLEASGPAADVVVSRHTIEHIPAPIAFLAALRGAFDQSPRARLFLETPDHDWIVRHGAVHDYFYEHCSLFTAASMAIGLKRAGFAPLEISSCFGGQYLWVVAKAEHYAPREAAGVGHAYIERWRQDVADAQAAGPVVIWGAGAKGATFASLIDPAQERIAAIVDINPAKQGRYLPGTGHPIVAPNALVGMAPATVFVMNPNYRHEIADELSALGLAPRIQVVD